MGLPRKGLLLALLATAAVGVGGSSATAHGEDGRILFTYRVLQGTHHDKVPSTIASVRPDGTDLKKLAPGEDPAASPTDGRIAYERRGQIAFANSQGKNRRGAYCSPAHGFFCSYPTFSPDGKHLAFLGDRDTGTSVGVTGVYTVRLKGDHKPKLITPAGDAPRRGPTYTPDGKSIVYSTQTQVRMVRLGHRSSAHDVSELGPSDSGSELGAPSASPNGKKIAFSLFDGSEGGDSGLYTVNVNGTGLQRIDSRSVSNHDAVPDYSPSGRRIVFGRRLETIRATGGGRRYLASPKLLTDGKSWDTAR